MSLSSPSPTSSLSSPSDSDIITISPPSTVTSLDHDGHIEHEHFEHHHQTDLDQKSYATAHIDVKPIVFESAGTSTFIPSAEAKSEKVESKEDIAAAQRKEIEAAERERELQRKMDETVRSIREQSDRLQAAAAPYAERTRGFAESQPVLFTFLSIFIALSVIPVLCFGTFLIGATLFVLGVAATGICISLFLTIIISTSILIPILLFTFFISTLTLSFLLFLFLAHRLYLHLSLSTTTTSTTKNASGEDQAQAQYEYDYEHLTAGLQNWYDETKDRVVIDGSFIERILPGSIVRALSLGSSSIGADADAHAGSASDARWSPNQGDTLTRSGKKVRWSGSVRGFKKGMGEFWGLRDLGGIGGGKKDEGASNAVYVSNDQFSVGGDIEPKIELHRHESNVRAEGDTDADAGQWVMHDPNEPEVKFEKGAM